MYALHATKKLLDRVKPSEIRTDRTSSTTFLGSWYATALFWKPQVALLVNESTLLPVLMPLAPAGNFAQRFPEFLARVLSAHGVPHSLIAGELLTMNDVHYRKTESRSLVGMLNQFSYLAEGYRDYKQTSDLLTLSMKLAETPCSPLYKRAISPDRELRRLIETRLQKDPAGE